MSTTPPNLAATIVAGLTTNRELGAVVLRGFLDNSVTPARLYTDETFCSWYEFDPGLILYNRSGGGNHLYYAMDIVWLAYETPVTKCRMDRACLFAATDEVEMAEDPAAGPRKPSYP